MLRERLRVDRAIGFEGVEICPIPFESDQKLVDCRNGSRHVELALDLGDESPESLARRDVPAA